MAVLRKRVTKDGVVYDVDFRYKGRRYVKSTKSGDIKIARQVLHDIQGKIARGTFNLLEFKKKDLRLSEFLEEYLAYSEKVKNPGTVNLERIHSKKLVGIIGNPLLRSIDARLLDHWKATLLQRVNPTTFNIERRTLHAMFNMAVKWEYLEVNSFAHVKRVRVEERRMFLVNEELEVLFRAMDKNIETASNKRYRKFHWKFRLYAEFLLNTGLRREEGLRLSMEHIDLNRNVLYIEKTKDKDSRIVPLTRRAREILSEVSDGLFSDLKKSLVSRKFAEACHAAGIKGFKLHSLRHTFATKLIEAGVDVMTVSKILGHSEIKTTMIYAKVQFGVLKSAVRKFEDLNRLNNLLPQDSKSLEETKHDIVTEKMN